MLILIRNPHSFKVVMYSFCRTCKNHWNDASTGSALTCDPDVIIHDLVLIFFSFH